MNSNSLHALWTPRNGPGWVKKTRLLREALRAPCPGSSVAFVKGMEIWVPCLEKTVRSVKAAGLGPASAPVCVRCEQA